MGVNVVNYGGRTLVDMRNATATAATVLAGYTAYGSDGNLIVGTASSTKRTEMNVTLPVSGWVDNQQIISVSGVTAGSTVVVGGDQDSEPEYSTCEVYCSDQADGSLTFSCTYLPMEDVVANVLILT
jgi:hypothetical protein